MNNKKQYRFANRFFGTFEQAIDSDMFSSIEVVEVPAIQYNRRKYNRMNTEEQEVYEERLKDTKTEFRLYLKNKQGVFVIANLTACNYFDKWQEAYDIKTNPDNYCNNKELAHLFNGKGRLLES